MNATRFGLTEREIVADEVHLWEAAYSRFETPNEEVRKFRRRLIALGIAQCPREANVVELFCGRGNGLEALAQLGFHRIEGVDLSPRLLRQYKGFGACYVADCRQLPFADHSKDILIVQGGLHHLSSLPGDLEQVLSEVRRVLRKSGRFVVVEPWLTPFLQFVHVLCDRSYCRRFSGKLDALAVMIEYEQQTYWQWLQAPDLILRVIRGNFEPQYLSTNWGKLSFIGKPK
jgi:ubiquinone/menaquinone biosynthesis C-methylase UbiE